MRYHRHRRTAIVIVLGLLGLAGTAPAAVAQSPPEEIEYYATDALGSVRIVFTPLGQVLGRSDYLPFGETLNQSGALPRQRFTGQERDGEAGLDYFNARSFQVRTGRMNAPDPLFGSARYDPQQWNRYAYVRNQPLTNTDPSGMQFHTETVAHAVLEPLAPLTIKTTNLISYSTSFPLGEGGDIAGAESPESAVVGGGIGGDDGQQVGSKPPPGQPDSSPSQPSTLLTIERQKVYAGVVKPMLRTLFRIPGAWDNGSTVCRQGNCYYAMPPYTDSDSGYVRLRWCPADQTTIAFLHRHTTSDEPSGVSFYNDRTDLYLAGVTYPSYLFYMVGRLGLIYDFSAGYSKGPYDSLFK